MITIITTTLNWLLTKLISRLFGRRWLELKIGKTPTWLYDQLFNLYTTVYNEGGFSKMYKLHKENIKFLSNYKVLLELISKTKKVNIFSQLDYQYINEFKDIYSNLKLDNSNTIYTVSIIRFIVYCIKIPLYLLMTYYWTRKILLGLSLFTSSSLAFMFTFNSRDEFFNMNPIHKILEYFMNIRDYFKSKIFSEDISIKTEDKPIEIKEDIRDILDKYFLNKNDKEVKLDDNKVEDSIHSNDSKYLYWGIILVSTVLITGTTYYFWDDLTIDNIKRIGKLITFGWFGSKYSDDEDDDDKGIGSSDINKEREDNSNSSQPRFFKRFRNSIGKYSSLSDEISTESNIPSSSTESNIPSSSTESNIPSSSTESNIPSSSTRNESDSESSTSSQTTIRNSNVELASRVNARVFIGPRNSRPSSPSSDIDDDSDEDLTDIINLKNKFFEYTNIHNDTILNDFKNIVEKIKDKELELSNKGNTRHKILLAKELNEVSNYARSLANQVKENPYNINL